MPPQQLAAARALLAADHAALDALALADLAQHAADAARAAAEIYITDAYTAIQRAAAAHATYHQQIQEPPHAT